MDTAISNGDFLLDSRRIPIQISGIEEILQRILIRLKVKQESFIYDRNLGSGLYTLNVETKDIQDKARDMIIEALKSMNEINVEKVFVSLIDKSENIDVHVKLRINDNLKDVVITV